MGITGFSKIFFLLILIAAVIFSVIAKKYPNTRGTLSNEQRSFVYTIAVIELVSLFLFLAGVWSYIKPFGLSLTPLPLLTAVAGFATSIFLFIKRRLLLLAAVMLILSLFLIQLTGLVLLFQTM